MNLQRIPWLALVIGVLCVAASGRADMKPVVARKPNTLRTYRFTARIVYNGGITPFKVGTKLTGEFTYDLAAHNESKLKWYGNYKSRHNKITIRYGTFVVSSGDPVRVGVSVLPARSETFSIAGGKLKLPKGWRSRRDRDSGKDRTIISLYLQNQPTRKVLSSRNLPKGLNFWKRFEARMLLLDFFDGIGFPGGSVHKGARVYAKVEHLEPIDDKIGTPRSK